ncbi:MAG: TlpA family protein disulfide reductase [Candidatus Eremiobacteraeota bacterium]|nr:TlpA family protein disulfide reductase [Candidatus Eremiobacteraeota bacterium]
MPLFILCAATLPSAAQARRNEPPSTGLRTVSLAKPPPDFTFNAGRGPQSLGALKGKPVVINFWATYCPPCRDELDMFEKLHASYGSAIDLLTINDEPPGTARMFLQQRGLDIPVVDDPDGKIFAAYSLTNGGGPIPVTIVVRPDGTVSYVSIGEMTYGELNAAVAAALSIPASASPVPSGV